MKIYTNDVCCKSSLRQQELSVRRCLVCLNAGLAESADATDSKSVDLVRKGSSPLSSTTLRVPGSPRSELPKEQYEKPCAPPPNFGYVSQSMKNLLVYYFAQNTTLDRRVRLSDVVIHGGVV